MDRKLMEMCQKIPNPYIMNFPDDVEEPYVISPSTDGVIQDVTAPSADPGPVVIPESFPAASSGSDGVVIPSSGSVGGSDAGAGSIVS